MQYLKKGCVKKGIFINITGLVSFFLVLLFYNELRIREIKALLEKYFIAEIIRMNAIKATSIQTLPL